MKTLAQLVSTAIAAVLLLLLSTQSAFGEEANQGESALEMANNCRPIAVAAISGNRQIYVADKNLMCWGAFSAMQWALNVYTDPSSKTPVLYACIPADASRQQLIAVFVSYVDKHPERMHLPYQQVVASAMQSTFPCRK